MDGSCVVCVCVCVWWEGGGEEEVLEQEDEVKYIDKDIEEVV